MAITLLSVAENSLKSMCKTFPLFHCQHNNQLSWLGYVPLPFWTEQGEWQFPATRRRKILSRREPAYWHEIKLFHQFQWHFCLLQKEEIWPSAIWKALHRSQLSSGSKIPCLSCQPLLIESNQLSAILNIQSIKGKLSSASASVAGWQSL